MPIRVHPKTEFKKGHKAWNKNKTNCYSEETIKKMSLAKKGKTSPRKGKHLSEETKKKLSISHLGKRSWLRGRTKESGLFPTHVPIGFQKGHTIHNTGRTNIKKGEALRKGKHHTEEAKRKMSIAKKGKHPSPKTEFKKGQFSKEKHLNWHGGISFEPYGIEFNEELKQKIRKRDHYRCQECFRHQSELRTKTNKSYKLHIHHINFNKQNNNPLNLISLCINCHQQTSFNRQNWINHFQNRIKEFIKC